MLKFRPVSSDGSIGMSLTAQHIAEMTGGLLSGDGSLSISAVQTVDRARPDDLTFAGDEKHARLVPASAARLVIVQRNLTVHPAPGQALISVDDVDLAVGKVLEHLAPPPPLPAIGIHPSAVIDPSARIGNNCRIGPHVVIGPNATVGDGCTLHPRVCIMDHASLGRGLTLWPGVVIYDRCTVGDGSILHAGVVIGADGFGYRPSPDGREIIKIPQIGSVTIGRMVEIGANTTVDRAKFDATIIGDGCKIDNLVQIAHNCRLGRGVIIAGQTGLAGSVQVGDGVIIGGGVDLRDHITIGPGARIAGGSQVMNDVPAGETWAGSPAQEIKAARREYVAVRQLPEVMKQVRKQLKDMA